MSEARKLNDLRVVDLKAELENRGLDKTGNKAQLSERLSDALKKDGHDPATFEFPTADASQKKGKKQSINRLFGLSKADNSEESLAEDGDADGDDEINAVGAGDAGTDGVKEEDDPDCQENGQDQDSAPNKEKDAAFNDMDVHVQDLDYNEDVQPSASLGAGGSGAVNEDIVIPEPDQVEPRCPFTVEDTIKLHAAAHPGEPGSNEKGERSPAGGGGSETLSRINSVSMIVNVPEESMDESGGALENVEEDEDDATFAETTTNLGEVEPAGSDERTEETGDGKDVEMKEEDDGKTGEEDGSKAVVSAEESEAKRTKEGEKKVDEKKVAKPGGEKSGGKGLWISGLSSTVRAADLKAPFSKYGRVTVAKVITSQKGGPKYFGFVTMSTADEASKCIQHLHRTDLKGRMISIERRDSIDGALKKLSSGAAAAKRAGGAGKTNATVKTVKHKATVKKEVRKTEKDDKEKTERSGEKKESGTEKREREPTHSHSRSHRSREPEKHRRIQRPLNRPPVRVGAPLRGTGRIAPGPKFSRAVDPMSRRRIAPPPDRARAIVNRYRNERTGPSHGVPVGRPLDHRGPPPAPRDARTLIQERGGFAVRDVRAPPYEQNPPDWRSDRQQLLEKFQQREIEHQRREEELKLQRERERIRFEREKLEREKLELQQLRLTQQTLQNNYAAISSLGGVGGSRGDLRSQPIGQAISPTFDVGPSAGGGAHGGIASHEMGGNRPSRHSTGGYQGNRGETRESRQSLPSSRPPREDRRGNSERDRSRHVPPPGRSSHREENRNPPAREVRGKRPAPQEPAVIDYRHGQRHGGSGGGHGSGGQGPAPGGSSRSDRHTNSSEDDVAALSDREENINLPRNQNHSYDDQAARLMLQMLDEEKLNQEMQHEINRLESEISEEGGKTNKIPALNDLHVISAEEMGARRRKKREEKNRRKHEAVQPWMSPLTFKIIQEKHLHLESYNRTRKQGLAKEIQKSAKSTYIKWCNLTRNRVKRDKLIYLKKLEGEGGAIPKDLKKFARSLKKRQESMSTTKKDPESDEQDATGDSYSAATIMVPSATKSRHPSEAKALRASKQPSPVPFGFPPHLGSIPAGQPMLDFTLFSLKEPHVLKTPEDLNIQVKGQLPTTQFSDITHDEDTVQHIPPCNYSISKNPFHCVDPRLKSYPVINALTYSPHNSGHTAPVHLVMNCTLPVQSNPLASGLVAGVSNLSATGRSGGRDHRGPGEPRRSGVGGEREREERDRPRGGAGQWPAPPGITPGRGERDREERGRGGTGSWPPPGGLPAGGASRHQPERRDFYPPSRATQPSLNPNTSWTGLQQAPTPQFAASIPPSWTGRGVPGGHLASGGAGIWPQPTAQLLSGSLGDARYDNPPTERFDAYKYIGRPRY